MKRGDKFKTNKRYDRLVSKTPRAGVCLTDERPDGTHRTRLDGFTNPQIIHKSLMEKMK